MRLYDKCKFKITDEMWQKSLKQQQQQQNPQMKQENKVVPFIPIFIAKYELAEGELYYRHKDSKLLTVGVLIVTETFKNNFSF